MHQLRSCLASSSRKQISFNSSRAPEGVMHFLSLTTCTSSSLTTGRSSSGGSPTRSLSTKQGPTPLVHRPPFFALPPLRDFASLPTGRGGGTRIMHTRCRTVSRGMHPKDAEGLPMTLHACEYSVPEYMVNNVWRVMSVRRECR